MISHRCVVLLLFLILRKCAMTHHPHLTPTVKNPVKRRVLIRSQKNRASGINNEIMKGLSIGVIVTPVGLMVAWCEKGSQNFEVMVIFLKFMHRHHLWHAKSRSFVVCFNLALYAWNPEIWKEKEESHSHEFWDNVSLTHGEDRD